MKDKFSATGPLFGLEAHWTLFNHLSLYSQWGLRLLFGEVYLHQDETKMVNLYDTFNKIQLAIEGAIGLQLSYQCFVARAGFVIDPFPSINQLMRFNDPSMEGKVYGNQGDLSLYGFSLGLGIKFLKKIKV